MNLAPTFTSGATGMIAENAANITVAYDANATDDGENSGTLIYSLSAGGDNNHFNINACHGRGDIQAIARLRGADGYRRQQHL